MTRANLEPAPNAKVGKEEALAVLTDEILDQTLAPGTPLVERVLAERFQLSRTPIREILRRLERDRLVDVRPNQGVFVRTPTVRDLRELFELRIALEPMAAGSAARNRPDDGVRTVRELFDEARARGEDDPKRLVTLGQTLHDAIAEWTANALLIEVYGLLRKQTRLVRHMGKLTPDLENRSFYEHLAILDAVERRDEHAARDRMRGHLQRTDSDLSRWFGSA